jgi:hypothetical protein
LLSTFTLSQIEPIPLSNEIIVKAGFTHGVSEFKTSYFTSMDMFIVESKKYKGERYFFGDYKTMPNRWYYFDYVHQLQNFYFALTKKELEISLVEYVLLEAQTPLLLVITLQVDQIVVFSPSIFGFLV